MSDIASASQAPAGTGEGIAPASGQAGDQVPAGSVSTQSPREQPSRAPQAETTEQPAKAAESVGRTAQDWERDYKALQSAYTRATQAIQPLVQQHGDLNAIQQNLQILNQLREHPGFIKWVQEQVAEEQTGSKDPDTVRALQVVQDMARQEAQQMVAPLYAQHIQNKVQTVFSEMDKEYGQEWQQLKPKMNEILQDWKRQGLVSPQVEHNFNYQFVKSLYAAAAAADPDFAAKAYQKRLEQKQANVTTSQPGTAAAATAAGPIRSMRDAYAAALREHGRS